MGKNLKIIITIGALIFSLTSKYCAQSKSHHHLSVGAGYYPDPDMAGKRGEFIFSYLFSKKHFYAKLETGISPFTNFGTVTRIYPTLGFTTKLENKLSWHLGAGIGTLFSSKKYFFYGDSYEFGGTGYILNTGFLFKYNELLKFGIESSFGTYVVDTHEPHGSKTNGIASFINCSVYFSLNKKRPL